MNRMVFVAYVCIAFGCRCMPAYVIRISTPRYTPGPDRSIKRTILLQAKLDGNNGFCEARQIRNGHRWAPWRFFPSKPYVSTGLQFQTVSFGGAHSGQKPIITWIIDLFGTKLSNQRNQRNKIPTVEADGFMYCPLLPRVLLCYEKTAMHQLV